MGLQFAAFYLPKGHLLACKRWPFAKQKTTFCQGVDNQLFTCGRLLAVRWLSKKVMNKRRMMDSGRPSACSLLWRQMPVKVKIFYSKKPILKIITYFCNWISAVRVFENKFSPRRSALSAYIINVIGI